MLKQYGILTMCQIEIEKCDLPIIDKLKLDMQLIQAKRILLEGKVSNRVRNDAQNEKAFLELYDQIKHVCLLGGPASGVEEVIARLVVMKEELEMLPRKEKTQDT